VIVTDNRTPCRCSRDACRARTALAKHPARYAQEPRCPACGRRSLKVIADRAAERGAGRPCRCSSLPFPHRRGSLRFCQHHPLAGTDPTHEELDDYQRIIETPRGCAA